MLIQLILSFNPAIDTKLLAELYVEYTVVPFAAMLANSALLTPSHYILYGYGYIYTILLFDNSAV